MSERISHPLLDSNKFTPKHITIPLEHDFPPSAYREMMSCNNFYKNEQGNVGVEEDGSGKNFLGGRRDSG